MSNRPIPHDRSLAVPQERTEGLLASRTSLRGKIPDATINRLTTYVRDLNHCEEEGLTIVSSAELARRCTHSAAQIRKDLAYFGEFGVRGKGYFVKELKETLKNILGVTRIWKVALVGAGNLGVALLSYKGFLGHGFSIEVAFDRFPERVRSLGRGIPPVFSMSKLEKVIRKNQIRIGIVAVPSEVAQDVVRQLVDAGVKGILNFAPTQVVAPPHVKIKNLDLGSELEALAYYLSQKEKG